MIDVVDTSIFLADHHALSKLRDRHVVIPLVVLVELEGKRSHPELGFAARQTLRELEELRSVNGSLIERVEFPEGGSVRIEMNHSGGTDLPVAFQDGSCDSRILSVAHSISVSDDVRLLSKDITLRLKASLLQIDACDFSHETDKNLEIQVVDVSSETVDELYSTKAVDLGEHTINTNLIVKSNESSALGRVKADGLTHLVQNSKVFDVTPRSAEQRFAVDLLTDPDIEIVSIAGNAGTGKSLLALAAGLEAVVERKEYSKVIVFRPLYPVGGQDLGFLPGDFDEKMSPWKSAVLDALEAFCNEILIEEIVERDLLQVLPLTHIRGRTLNNVFVILDETQNYEMPVILTALSRMGQGSKVVLTYDISQRDNLRVGKHDGVAAVANKLTGHDIFGHITLRKSERSKIAELASTLLQ